MIAIFNGCKSKMKQIDLIVSHESLPRFTTLLQSGIYLEVAQGTSIANLLFNLPGFSAEYVKASVQTIFLNGLPADNLEQQLFGEQIVLAISAAMPGLAGAIFRKDGAHASLRTETAAELLRTENDKQPAQVRLKLFNIIAIERGAELLGNGCTIPASSFCQFLAYRPPLFANISSVTLDNAVVDPATLTSHLQNEKMIKLTIRSSHGS